VVVNVEEGQLILLLADDEEHGVEHLDTFAKVVPPEIEMTKKCLLLY
jgi:hypothetical protein